MNHNPVILESILTGLIALLVWAFIWLRSLQSPLRWTNPVSLFAVGLQVMYIIPTLFWQFRPWQEIYPPYYNGLPLVMIGAIVLGIPFLFYSPSKRHKYLRISDILQRKQYGSMLWLLVFPVLSAIAYRMYLFTLGFQGRNFRETPTVAGSETLAVIVYELTVIFPVFYYPLVALGNRHQRRIGFLFWLIDGLIQLSTLHRWAILIFLLRSAIFVFLMCWRINIRRWIGLGIVAILIIAIIGEASLISRDRAVSTGSLYITPVEIVSVLGEATGRFLQGNSNLIDYVMFRFHMARSASAVMMGVPEIIPYAYGETFLDVLYAWIPRYLWPDKPSLRDVHLLTSLVMPKDIGQNPTGTIAELYVNYGFVAIFLGGLLCLWICKWQERTLLRGGHTSRVWLCVYPVMAIWFFWSDANLSQRLSKGLHMLLIFIALWLFLKMASYRWVGRRQNLSVDFVYQSNSQ